MSLPRIITVDTSGFVSTIVRSALHLLDSVAVQIDAPNSEQAYYEAQIGENTLVISAWQPDPKVQGWELAAHLKNLSPDIEVVVLANEHDPPMDEATQADSPFVYLQRPFDAAKLVQVLDAFVHERDIRNVSSGSSGGGGTNFADLGPVPSFDVNVARTMVASLLRDLGAMAIMLCDRNGEILLEEGATGYIDRDHLTSMLTPTAVAHASVHDLIGGESSSLQFYDGDSSDIFVLSIGLHHFLCVLFDGQNGSRQLGAVNTFGRRGVQDLITTLGASAWTIEKPRPKTRATETTRAVKAEEVVEEPIQLVKSEAFAAEEEEEEPLVQLEAIPEDEFDLDDLFGGGDELNFDDLFSEENVEKLAQEIEPTKSKYLSDGEARDIGIF